MTGASNENNLTRVAMEMPTVTTRDAESITPSLDWHKRTVDATHALVLHSDALHSMLGLENAAWKYVPVIVYEPLPVRTPLLARTCDIAGASKLNRPAPVAPIELPMETNAESLPSASDPLLAWQFIRVPVLHDALAQIDVPMRTVMVLSLRKKLMPYKVAEDPPDTARLPLAGAHEMTGPSRVNARADEPTIVLIVTVGSSLVHMAPSDTQLRVDADSHWLVRHERWPSDTDGVGSADAKSQLKPKSDTCPPPVGAAFEGKMEDSTGES
jgi:hypothetical protein